MDIAYVMTPFLAWLAAGTLKFAINSIKAGRLALDLIGYGGLPSNHAAIVSSIAILIALREGIEAPAFGLAVAVCFIVILDAVSLRRQIGRQARVINRLGRRDEKERLRERIGHTPVEIAAGLATGALVAVGADRLPILF